MESKKQLHVKRENLKGALHRYQQSFVDTATGMLKEEISQERDCPVCGNGLHEHFIFMKNGVNHFYCSRCNLVFAKNILNKENMKKYYAELPHLQESFAQHESDFYNKQYTDGLNTILSTLNAEHLNGRHLKILDYGCSSGIFLKLCEERNFENITGIELNESDRLICKQRGLNVYSDLKSLKEKYDIITLWDVFEHIPDPFSFLEEVNEHIDNNGIIFMQIPSCQALAARILREKCNMFDGIEHLNLYSEHSIKEIAKRIDFSVIQCNSVIDEIFPINNYLSYLDPYLPVVDSSKDLAIPLSVSDILNTNIGYKLQVILKKN